MENTRLPKCVVIVELVGSVGCMRGKGKEWMECLLDDLRAFSFNANEWPTAAQDERG